MTERFELSLQAHAHNALNHTQFSPGYSMGLGNTETVDDKASGRAPGAGQSANFGTRGLGTHDPRNMELVLKLRFFVSGLRSAPIGIHYADGYQCPPVNWGINTERKKQFFGLLKEVTGA